MTQKLLSIIALLCLTFTSARADVTYSYNESTQTLTISGTGAMDDYDNVFDRTWDGYCSSIKSIVIGNGVTSIGKNAFNNCEFLESITIPANVKSISEYAFYSCQKLTTVIFDGTPTLATIGKYAFRDCLSLESITIPASVTSIGDEAFMCCSELMSVEVYAPSCTLGSDAFKDTKLEKISVPNEKVAAYKTAENWSNYSSKITGLIEELLIETGKPYIVKTLNDNSGVPVNCQTFLPVGYDLSKATVTLKPVKGAPKGLPVIIGSTTDGEVIPADAYLQLAADPGDTSGKITSDDIATDYNSVADDMSKRFVITDGKDNLSKILEGIKDVSASDAIFFVLTNGKFTRVSVSADDLAENANPAKSGLLLFILTKWEYMNMGSGSGSSGQAGAGSRTIGIGEGGTTGISPIENEELRIKSSAGAWYDLQGRSLNGKPTTKGLYIHQGRKVVMK